MPDFAQLRRTMVDGQIRTYDVTDPDLIAALDAVPRERFVADSALAYTDRPQAMLAQSDRQLMTPMVFARLAQAAGIRSGDRVLIVGCGTGYGAAVIAGVAGAVVALESDPALADAAKSVLASLGASGAEVVVGPLPSGVPSKAPFDVVLLEGAFETEPETLLSQLADGGRLVGVRGRGRAARAVVYTRSGTVVGDRTVTEAAAPVLPGFTREPAFVF
ncbi:protein-L-isoaspartate O-methyltransferase family protein [Alsobacter sp. R-9]